MKLISIEDQIIKATIRALLDDAEMYDIMVNDGEAGVLGRATRDASLIFDSMQTTDEDYLLVHKPRSGFKYDRDFSGCDGWVRFTYGNGETDVISDYTVNLKSVMVKITALIDEYEAR